MTRLVEKGHRGSYLEGWCKPYTLGRGVHKVGVVTMFRPVCSFPIRTKWQDNLTETPTRDMCHPCLEEPRRMLWQLGTSSWWDTPEQREEP